MSDEALRDAVSSDLRPSPGCAPAERIWVAAGGGAPRSEVAALLDHSALCGQCAAAWRLARELLAEAAPPARTQPLPFRGRGGFLAGAAALLAAASLFLVLRRTPEPIYRGAEGRSVRSLVSEAPQKRTGLVLRWSGPPGARYAVTLTTQDLQPVHRAAGLTTPEARVPESALAALPRGATLFWRVEAALSDGTREASAVFTVHLE